MVFEEETLDRPLSGLLHEAESEVDAIPEDQFLICSDQDIVENIVAQHAVEPIVLQEDAKTMTPTETKISNFGGPGWMFCPEGRGPSYVRGTCVKVDIPFKGDGWLFRYQTDPRRVVFPQRRVNAEVDKTNLRITIVLRHDAEPETFKKEFEGDLEFIKGYVRDSHDQVTEYNRRLYRLVREAIRSRRERLSKHKNIAALLNIPIASKANAPSLTPVKIKPWRPPPLPVPPKTGLVPEPAVDDSDYETILHFIRHLGRTFETTPATFSVHDEEELRNIILALLNGQFKGAAVGEVFRRRGKTDICIEQDNRAAFVGECKTWRGPASLTGALDQLLGYLTWRDSKASIIVFNSRNKRFSSILKSVPEAISGHSLFVRDLPCGEDGEWRVEMRSSEDEGRRVTVHIFIFDLYTDSRRDRAVRPRRGSRSGAR